MPIRVAMLADHPGLGAPTDGGVQAVTTYLADALARSRRVELHVLRFQAGINRTYVQDAESYVLHTIPMSRFGTLTGFREDQNRFDRQLLAIKPDVVHSQGAGQLGVIAKRSRYPVVVTVHGIISREVPYFSTLARRLRARAQGWMSHFYCIRGATHTILISPYVADYYGDALRGEKYLIANPVDPRFFSLPRVDESGQILFAGKVRALKGVLDLVTAFSKLGDIAQKKLVLAGSLSDEDYVKKVRRRVKQLGMSGLVEFRGLLNLDEYLNELSVCACLVLPSYQETAPMVIQEAMACGVPVIASNICGIPYQIADDSTGLLIEPGNIEGLASKLQIVTADASTRRRLGEAAKHKAVRDYSAERVVESTIKVYEKMLRGGLS